MNIRDLTVFLHLCETCHFAKTASAMHITASTLSRQIQRLEDEIKQPLFSRDNRSVQLTKAGEKVKHYASQILLCHQQMQQALQVCHEQLAGEIHLFCSVTAAYSHLPNVLDRFRQAFPYIDIKITTGDAAAAVDMILSNQADLAIAGKPAILPKSVAFKKIDEISMLLLAPAQHYSINQAIIQSTWQKIPFLLPQYGPSRMMIDKWLKQKKITNAQIYSDVSGHEAIISMVALGCGAAILPSVVYENSAESIKKRITVYAISLAPFDLGICVQRKRIHENVVHAFWQLLSETDN